MTFASIPGLGRRLLAILYDALVLAGVLMLAALPWTLLGGDGDGWLPRAAARLAFQFYLLAVVFGFFGWFWTHGGQTLGMRAWRLRVVDSASGGGIGWRQAALRFAAAGLSVLPLGLGLFWVLVDRERRAWHDRIAGTRLILVPGTAAQPTRRNM